MQPELEPTRLDGDDEIPTRLYVDTGQVATFMLGDGMRGTVSMVDGTTRHVYLIDRQRAYDGSHYMLIGREEPRDERRHRR